MLSGRNLTSAWNLRQHYWARFPSLLFSAILVNNHERSTRGAFANGDVAGLPHHLRGHRYRDAGIDGDRRVEVAAHERRSLSDAGAALGQRHGNTLRGRRSFGNGAFV